MWNGFRRSLPSAQQYRSDYYELLANPEPVHLVIDPYSIACGMYSNGSVLKVTDDSKVATCELCLKKWKEYVAVEERKMEEKRVKQWVREVLDELPYVDRGFLTNRDRVADRRMDVRRPVTHQYEKYRNSLCDDFRACDRVAKFGEEDKVDCVQCLAILAYKKRQEP